jgi:hypothetical protein
MRAGLFGRVIPSASNTIHKAQRRRTRRESSRGRHDSRSKAMGGREYARSTAYGGQYGRYSYPHGANLHYGRILTRKRRRR